MLSDEERKAIEYLKQNNIVEIQYDNYGLESIHRVGIDEKQTILNLIEKQSKELEKLKEDNQRYKRIASQKLDDIEEFRKNECEHRCIRNAEVLELKEYYQENYTPNDKIKAKIEELKLIADNGANAVRFAMTHDDEVERIQKQKDIRTMVEILQSFLEKE